MKNTGAKIYKIFPRLAGPFATEPKKHFSIVRQSEVVSQIFARIDTTEGNKLSVNGKVHPASDTSANSLLSLYKSWQKKD